MTDRVTNAIPRPVIIYWMYRDDVGRRVVLTPPDQGSAMTGRFYSTPLRERFAAFLVQHSRCAACSQSAPTDLCACACGKDGLDVLDLRLTGTDEAEFDRILKSELDLHRKAARIEAGKPDRNPLTEDEVGLLLKLQDGLCFYCANELPPGRSGPQFDRDHYVPVERGGKTTLENTVLACPFCNRKKGNEDGYEFGLQMRGARKPEMKARYAAMRTRFRIFMRRLGRKHIACDASRAALVLRRPDSK
jgi:5-methylcytosine-specific restriction endonuclease McrA